MITYTKAFPRLFQGFSSANSGFIHRLIPYRKASSFTLAAIALLLSSIALALEPRQPLEVPAVYAPVLPGTPLESGDATALYYLVVKFEDAAQVRPRSNSLESLTQWDLGATLALAQSAGGQFQQLLSAQTCDGLDGLILQAEQLSGRAQPDLAGLMRFVPGQAMTMNQMIALGNDLLALDEVEFAVIANHDPGLPPSPPPTPDYTPLQAPFFGPDPGGEFAYANSEEDLRGEGMILAELSPAFNRDHEDLPEIFVEPGFDNFPLYFLPLGDIHNDPTNQGRWNRFVDHGTSSLGINLAQDNGYGMTGAAPNAFGRFYPSHTWNSLIEDIESREYEAFCNALEQVADAGPGHVLYLELQANVPHLLPREIDVTVWMLTRLGTDAGVIIVSPAGNGNQDLDSPGPPWGDQGQGLYQQWRDWGDSGAILVGAGTSDTNHNRASFSNYGSRVNAQGWGFVVHTLGGDNEEEGLSIGTDPDRRYTGVFGGTSAATPMVAAAALLTQQYVKSQAEPALSPADMRYLLIHTGIPQGDPQNGHVGPFINTRAMIEQYNEADVAVYSDVNPAGNVLSTHIDNLGPRIATDVLVSVTYVDPHHNAEFSINFPTLPDQCAVVPVKSGTICPGFVCPITVECLIDELAPSDLFVIDGHCIGTTTVTVDAEAVLGGAFLIDPVPANNSEGTQFSNLSCSPGQTY